MAEKNTVPYEELELYRIRHSTSHIITQAVEEMFEPGEAKLAIGPPIANGFYYDFELPRQLSSDRCNLPFAKFVFQEIQVLRHGQHRV